MPDRSNLMLVPPQTITAYYAALAPFNVEYAEELIVVGLVDSEEVRAAFESSLEVETVPRRFTPRQWLLQEDVTKQPIDSAG